MAAIAGGGAAAKAFLAMSWDCYAIRSQGGSYCLIDFFTVGVKHIKIGRSGGGAVTPG